MKLTTEQYEKIRAYLNEELSPEGEAAFLREVQADETLQDHLRFEIELRENAGALAKAVAQRKNNLSFPPGERAAKKRQPEKGKVISFWAVTAIAASLLVVAAGLVLLLLNPFQKPVLAKKDPVPATQQEPAKPPLDTSLQRQTPAPETDYAALYDKFYSKDGTPKLPAGFEELSLALMAYEGGDYGAIRTMAFQPTTRGKLSDQALRRYEELVRYYRGLSYLQTKDYKEAAANLQWVMDKSREKPLAAKAAWYAALLHLQQRDETRAVPLLQKVANDHTSPRAKKASELLAALKQR